MKGCVFMIRQCFEAEPRHDSFQSVEQHVPLPFSSPNSWSVAGAFSAVSFMMGEVAHIQYQVVVLTWFLAAPHSIQCDYDLCSHINGVQQPVVRVTQDFIRKQN